MKTFCPNCEKETESEFLCEVYLCKDCEEDSSNYEKPMYNKLKEIIEGLIIDSNALAEELKLEQNPGYECAELFYHRELISKIISMQVNGEI
jgi:tRNA(Ile2) C34 agmatinyltransferase TiaS